MDVRARNYVRGNQNILASDMIFSNGNELTDAAVGALEKAASAEQVARAASNETLASRQSFALVAAAAAAALVVLPVACRRGRGGVPGVRRAARAGAARRRRARGRSPPRSPTNGARRVKQVSRRRRSAVLLPKRRDAPPVVNPPTQPVPAFDFTAVAALCTDLSRVDDTHGAAAAARAGRDAAQRRGDHPVDCRSGRA